VADLPSTRFHANRSEKARLLPTQERFGRNDHFSTFRTMGNQRYSWTTNIIHRLASLDGDLRAYARKTNKMSRSTDSGFKPQLRLNGRGQDGQRNKTARALGQLSGSVHSQLGEGFR